MVLAMTLNLLLAALMGVLIPMTMLKLGRDPAVGSSVLITAVTDSGGFFIFLGLATLLLVSMRGPASGTGRNPSSMRPVCCRSSP